MQEENGKFTCEAKLVVDRSDPKELVDLYVSVEEFRQLCKLFGSNRVTVGLRMKGIG